MFIDIFYLFVTIVVSQNLKNCTLKLLNLFATIEGKKRLSQWSANITPVKNTYLQYGMQCLESISFCCWSRSWIPLEKKDPDPGHKYFIKIYRFFLTKEEFSKNAFILFCLFILLIKTWWTNKRLEEIFNNSFFQFRFGFWELVIFFLQFLVRIWFRKLKCCG